MAERAFDKTEHWRGVAIRYHTMIVTYRAGFTMALILERLRSSGDTAWSPAQLRIRRIAPMPGAGRSHTGRQLLE
ncbi:hypothetical protein [Nocardia sp. CA-290969]|uniref:hypothetical protein n=1 Tax=Nocardia sp. CA-290969 TaxID=3239986 RepID=UPI003D8B31B7